MSNVKLPVSIQIMSNDSDLLFKLKQLYTTIEQLHGDDIALHVVRNLGEALDSYMTNKNNQKPLSFSDILTFINSHVTAYKTKNYNNAILMCGLLYMCYISFISRDSEFDHLFNDKTNQTTKKKRGHLTLVK